MGLVAPQHVGSSRIRDRTCLLHWQVDSLPLREALKILKVDRDLTIFMLSSSSYFPPALVSNEIRLVPMTPGPEGLVSSSGWNSIKVGFYSLLDPIILHLRKLHIDSFTTACVHLAPTPLSTSGSVWQEHQNATKGTQGAIRPLCYSPRDIWSAF